MISSTTNYADSPVQRIQRWKSGETPGPWEVNVFPTNRCNLDCKMCWRIFALATYGKKTYENELSDERLLTLVDEAADLGAREWTIVGGGDPMVRSKVVIAMCEKIRARGMNGVLHTNGMLFTREHLETLVRIGWNRVAVSLDAPDAEANNYIRGERCFERATQNLKLLDELRRSSGTEFPQSSLHMVVTNRGYQMLAQMVQLAHDLNCRWGAGFTHLIVESDSAREFELSPEQKLELPGLLDDAIQVARRLGVTTNIRELMPVGNLPTSEEVGGRSHACQCGDIAALDEGNCYEACLSANITANGLLGPCCVFYDDNAQSLHEMSLKEAWLGPYMTKVRRDLISRVELPSYCANCPSHLIAKTQSMRKQSIGRQTRLHRAQMSLSEHTADVVGRLRTNLRTRGVRKTMRRAVDWFQALRSG